MVKINTIKKIACIAIYHLEIHNNIFSHPVLEDIIKILINVAVLIYIYNINF
jgi:hypothetical protein